MRKLTAWLKKVSLGNWISIAALGLSVWATFCNSGQNSKIDQLQTESHALTFRPHLSMKQPLRMTFRVENPNLESSVFSDTTDLAFNLLLDGTATFVNDSSTPARFVAKAYMDTLTSEPVLRNRLRRLADGEHDIDFRASEDFYVDRYLQPGDSIAVAFEHGVEHMAADGFMLHLLVLYENESGQLFDTYYWSHYAIHELVVRPQITVDSTQFRLDGAFAWQDMLTALDPNESSYIYTPKESKAIWKAAGIKR